MCKTNIIWFFFFFRFLREINFSCVKMPPKKKIKKENSKFSFLNTILTHGEKKKKHIFFPSSSGNEIQKTFLLMKWKLFPPEFFSIFCVKLKSFFSLRAMGEKKNLRKSCFLLSYTTNVLYFFCEKNINKTNWKHIFMTFLGNFFSTLITHLIFFF